MSPGKISLGGAAPKATPSRRRKPDNAAVIRAEIAWFGDLLAARLASHGSDADEIDLLDERPPPALPAADLPYAAVLRRLGLSPAERLVLVLAYLPHISPSALDPLLVQNQSIQRRFTEFGGIVGQSHGGFMPTVETALFLLCGNDIAGRLRHQGLFGPTHRFQTEHVLSLDHRHPDEPPLSAALRLTDDYAMRLATGVPYHPPFGPDFPAQRLTTPHEWSDLVLDRTTRREVEDIAAWVRYQDRLMGDWQLNRRLKPGFRALFYGPPGTGKTLTASLLGKTTGLAVYRVDLSKVVSKYIGETEKNLASLFDHAQHQNWILFFDEADSLFGKRTESRSSNDRAANQQISYLLQRIEDFPGIVILATNLKTHLDEAFARRFQAIILFRMPNAEQRLHLWNDNFKDKPYPLAKDVRLERLAADHELSGGSILNVLRYACLRAVTRAPAEVTAQDLIDGVRRELHKDGKILN